MPPKGITIIDARKLNARQISELKQRIREYSVLQEYTKPLTFNLKTGVSQWLCATNEKGNVVGFVRTGINHKKRIITSYDRYVMKPYQGKGIAMSMIARQIALARGLGRYSIRIDWLDPHTSLRMVKKLGKILQGRVIPKNERNKPYMSKETGKMVYPGSKRGKVFKVGVTAHHFSKVAKDYIKNDYGKGKSFRAGMKQFRIDFPGEAVLRNVEAKTRGNKGAITDAWIQMKQKGNRIPPPPGVQRFGKALFSPKLPGNKPWRPRRRPL